MEFFETFCAVTCVTPRTESYNFHFWILDFLSLLGDHCPGDKEVWCEVDVAEKRGG